MKVVDVIVLIILFIILGIGLFVLRETLPVDEEQFQAFDEFNITSQVYSNDTQFYPNMRYSDSRISYTISTECGEKKRKNAVDSLFLISQKTMLRFYEMISEGQIEILCSNIPPETKDGGRIIAGEGGPAEIYISGPYYVIMSGKVSLYRSESCLEPKIALHEILHALGFDHNSNPSSILYPITDCKEEFDDYLIEEINRIYSIESAPDIAITNISAKKQGRYISFELETSNLGLKDAKNVSLGVYGNGKMLKTFDLGNIPLGNRKKINVENLAAQSSTSEVKFIVALNDDSKEISFLNNEATLNVI